MVQGINGDLVDITVYTATTPVEFTTSNIPLTELNTNVLLLDTKLEGYIQSGVAPLALGGDGTITAAVPFATIMSTSPSVVVGLANVTGTPPPSLTAYATLITTGGFTANIDGVGTGGAWTADVMWIADGR